MPVPVLRWMSKVRIWRGGPSLSALFVFTLVATGLIGSMLLVWSTITKERVEREQANRTSAVMAALRDIDRAALNAETGQRGYFITLNREYLASYELGRALYGPSVSRLRELMQDARDDPRQQDLLDRIEKHGDAKFAEIEETIRLIKDGQILEAQQLILSNRGQNEMRRLRAALSEMEAIEQGMLSRATGEAAASENRVLPLLAATLLLIIGALILGFWQAIHAARADAEANRSKELAEARDRADLLAHELNHRVKNLFAVILAIVRMSARDKPEAKEAVDGIAARIHALLDAHESTQGKTEGANEGEAELGLLIGKVLAPYASDVNPITVEGPKTLLNVREATPVGLVLHELATNAVKYGAWSQPGGRIAVDWSLDGAGSERRLRLVWREICVAPSAPGERKGFGSMLMQSSARQLGGTIDRNFDHQGAIVEMEFPHPE